MGSSRSSSGGFVSELDDPSLSLSKLLFVLYKKKKFFLNLIEMKKKQI